MKYIISRTLETTLKKVYLIATICIGVAAALLCNAYINDLGEVSFVNALDNALLLQHCLAFFLFGTAIMTIVVDSTSGMIANEVHEGTFRLLVAKPNTRSNILTAKIIGSVIGEIVLALIIVFSYFATLSLISKADGRLINELCRYWLPYLVYFIVLIFILSGITTLLSTIFKKKIAAFLPMMALVVITVAFFPIQRLVADLAGGNVSELVRYYDINYHLATIFKQCVETIRPISTLQSNQSILAYLMNLFTIVYVDKDIVLNPYAQMVVENKLVIPQLVNLMYFSISIICYILSYCIIRRKDV